MSIQIVTFKHINYNDNDTLGNEKRKKQFSLAKIKIYIPVSHSLRQNKLSVQNTLPVLFCLSQVKYWFVFVIRIL